MSFYVVCPRNCFSCIFGYCEACDGNGADDEERDAWDMARGMVMLFGCEDPGHLHRSCYCADHDHPYRRDEDESKEPLAVSPPSAIVISSDLL